jgi:hypothetical protein
MAKRKRKRLLPLLWGPGACPFLATEMRGEGGDYAKTLCCRSDMFSERATYTTGMGGHSGEGSGEGVSPKEEAAARRGWKRRAQ